MNTLYDSFIWLEGTSCLQVPDQMSQGATAEQNGEIVFPIDISDNFALIVMPANIEMEDGTPVVSSSQE